MDVLVMIFCITYPIAGYYICETITNRKKNKKS